MRDSEFGEAYITVLKFCDQLGKKLDNPPPDFTIQTESLLWEIHGASLLVAKLMMEVEGLCSGDYGQRSFRLSVEEILAESEE